MMTSPADNRNDPHAEYAARLAARRLAHDRHRRADRLLVFLRLAVVAAFIAIALLSLWRGLLSVWWLLAPTLLFVAVAAAHSRVAHAKGQMQQAMAFYAKGLARLEDRWTGEGVPGDEFADAAHPYTGALDIFGRGSLFELLCTARTHAGRETLARWLSHPAARAEIRARQEAVAELRDRLDLREALLAHAIEGASRAEREQLVAWATAPESLAPHPLRAIATIATLVVLGTTAASWAYGRDSLTQSVLAQSVLTPPVLAQPAFYASLLLAAIIGLIYARRVRDILTRADRYRPQLLSLQPALQLLQQEAWKSPHLDALRSRLDASGLLAVARIEQLDRLVSWCELKKLDTPVALLCLWKWNIVCAPLSFLFWHTQLACAIETWRARHGAAIAEWIAVAGEFEALCAIAGYAYEHPDQPFPELLEEGPAFDGEELRHPLIPRARCVPNTVRLDDSTRCLIVSGSNMSGKSTFLRTVGIHVVLASIGAPVPASRLRLSPLTIGATLQVHDSLRAGVSRFYAEIQRVRHIVDTAHEAPVLFLFDELFHGTNSRERTLAAEAVLAALVQHGAIGLVTTHDLALTTIADQMPDHARNVHFRDQFENGRLIFDHKMHPGVASTTNALALIAAMGLPASGRGRHSGRAVDRRDG